ncbi:hypothetical protein [Streptomyces mirabilis]|uniref:hypothetical protein n=1 Tax=Streptomyces mirabilis TaxID=68239 RepID=UPI003667C879
MPANFDTSNFGYDRAVSVPASYVPNFSSSEETCESGQSGFCTQVSVVTAETVRAHPKTAASRSIPWSGNGGHAPPRLPDRRRRRRASGRPLV